MHFGPKRDVELRLGGGEMDRHYIGVKESSKRGWWKTAEESTTS